MPENDKLIPMFQEAARIAESVPEQFRDAAFQRALDALLAPPPISGAPDASKANRGAVGIGSSTAGNSNEKTINRLLREVDSSAHPEIHDASTLRDQCLLVLRVMKNVYDVDGLTSAEVETLLASKFRVRVGEGSVRRALGGAGRLVDRIPEGKGFRYRIMEAGDQHVDALSVAEAQGESIRSRIATRSTKRHRIASAAPPANAANDAAGARESRDGRAARKRRDATVKGAGPATHLRALIVAGWFSSPRTVQTILTELVRRGAAYKRTDLTRLMINLVRSGELTRNKLAEVSGRSVWHYAAPNK